MQGGFGQVLEVVKRDCGKRYAMKVMHKEMMRRCLGSSWRKKIWLEKDLMASLSHPMLVNLLYAFQNQVSERGGRRGGGEAQGWSGLRCCVCGPPGRPHATCLPPPPITPTPSTPPTQARACDISSLCPPQEFLVLVMDLVPAGDLSEFVLTKKRLNADQARQRPSHAHP